MIKKFLGVVILNKLLNENAYTGIGDTCTCTTEKISQ